jgi:two-component system, chemotaxis family, protein-glutamate methylesterase/glutaminase
MVTTPGMKRNVVLIGASAGGIPALTCIFEGLPADLPAVIAVVLHRSPLHSSSHLADVFRRSARLPLVEPDEPMRIEPGVIYLAPRDRHLIMRADYVEPTRGPKEHFSRPAVDPLFRSAAEIHGRHAVGVLLTGWGHDGVSGLIAIKRQHGFAIVQDPDEARAPSMPTNALLQDHVDLVLPVARIAAALVRLARGNGAEAAILAPHLKPPAA